MNKILRNRLFIVIISLTLALICGTFFFVTTRHSLSGVTVIRMVKSVPLGTMIKDDTVKEEKMNNYNLPKGVIHNKSEIVGKYATVDLVEDDIATSLKVSASLNGNHDKLSNLDGTRGAISVMVKNLADSVSDKIMSGDIVSCFVTQDKRTTTPKELTYLEVVAITNKDGKDLHSNDTSTSQTVTVLATQEQAELLSNYDATGEIHFSLVYRGDRDTTQKFIDTQASVLKG